MRVLVVAAHPDDEVLGAGGTIVKYVKAGHEVFVCIVTSGDSSLYPVEILKMKREEVVGVHRFLGIKETFFLDFISTLIDQAARRDLISALNKVVQKTVPDVVYSHFWGDINQEHRLVNEAVAVVLRPELGKNVQRWCLYEVPSSTEWGLFRDGAVFKPNVFVDISDTLEEKKKALSLYASEIRAFPHPRSEEAVAAYAYKWGSTAGLPAAEAFQLVYSIERIG